MFISAAPLPRIYTQDHQGADQDHQGDHPRPPGKGHSAQHLWHSVPPSDSTLDHQGIVAGDTQRNVPAEVITNGNKFPKEKCYSLTGAAEMHYMPP